MKILIFHRDDFFFTSSRSVDWYQKKNTPTVTSQIDTQQLNAEPAAGDGMSLEYYVSYLVLTYIPLAVYEFSLSF
jgi:hypothetical protein